MIKTIFFDLGKVLADFDWKPAAHKVAECSVMTPGDIYDICTKSAMALNYETGKIETRVFFERLKSEIGFSGSPEKLRNLWSDIFTPIAKHVDLLNTIRRKYPVGLISNTNEAHVNWLLTKFRFLQWFPKPTYSYRVGYMKPHKSIYLEALNSHYITAEESLFIDDLETNVLAAQDLGMQAIHLTLGKDLAAELRKLNANLTE